MSKIEEAYNKFCIERFPLPSVHEVSELETRIAVTFPDDYRRFLLAFNGGYFREPRILPPIKECPLDRLTFMHGIRATHPTSELGSDADLAIFDDNNPPEVVPVGYTMMGGLILLVTHPEGFGEVLYKEPYGDFYFLADGIERFFGLLREPPGDAR